MNQAHYVVDMSLKAVLLDFFSDVEVSFDNFVDDRMIYSCIEQVDPLLVYYYIMMVNLL